MMAFAQSDASLKSSNQLKRRRGCSFVTKPEHRDRPAQPGVIHTRALDSTLNFIEDPDFSLTPFFC
jgi:hypothetical protein